MGERKMNGECGREERANQTSASSSQARSSGKIHGILLKDDPEDACIEYPQSASEGEMSPCTPPDRHEMSHVLTDMSIQGHVTLREERKHESDLLNPLPHQNNG
ncbi:hypothetical protein BaRGS_00013782 [Batillaria attramentaria]|uniref:Uncharacterized protein n=1 Tax=Batillaria attramentaria TaxID=370345 RepID=A0ABD0L611_9CAEN